MNSLLSLLLVALAAPSLINPFKPSSQIQRFANAAADTSRRILHQPLFPVTSISPPPPAEPPPKDPESDWPFFPQAPPESSPDPAHAIPAAPANLSASFHPASSPVHLNQKITIGVSVAIAALVMISALAFFLYRSRIKHPSGSSTKLVSDNSRQLMREEAPATTPPGCLYLGTVDPKSNRRAEPVNGMSGGGGEPSNRAPYHKLNPVQRQELHRPSPELQPLPPLNALPRRISPPNASSDEETSFYSAQESAATTTNSESSYSPLSRRVFPARNVKSGINSTSSTPHSHSIVSQSSYSNCSIAARKIVTPPPAPPPPTPPPPPPPLPPIVPRMQSQPPQYVQPKSSSPIKRKAKLPIPSPPSNLVLPPLTSNTPPPTQSERGSGSLVPDPPLRRLEKTSGIPPPPPPPPPPAILQKTRLEETSISPKPVRPLLRPQSLIPAPATDKQVEQTPPVVKVDNFGSSSGLSNEGDDMDGTKPRLKPFHWDKVRATSDRETVWDQLKSSSFQLNEDMIETLFVCNSTNPIQKEAARRPVLPYVGREIRVLDPKKSQNIAILLRALNVTQEEVSEALLNGNPEGLGVELFETLVKMAPTKEEELKLRDYNGDTSKLGAAERFLKAVLNIPFAFKRVDAMLYRANFDTEIKYLRKSFETLEAACQELKSSRLFLKLLEAVLRTGNRMNVGTNRGEAKAFKLDTLLKLVDIKGTDGKTTLLHFVVQEIIRSEGSGLDDSTLEDPNRTHPKTKEDEFKRKGLQVVWGLSNELSNVKKAAGMDLDVLNSYVSKLETGLEKIKMVLLHEKANAQGNFLEAMKLFLIEAENEITQIKAYEKTTLLLVKEITDYFHGDTAKEEAHPFRIFMIVRDFLSVLDQVCKEVGRTHDRTMVGSARSFRISTNASLPIFNRFNMKHEGVSDNDSSFS